jgi:hypothetical protein
MNKYNVGEKARLNDAWYEIMGVRFDLDSFEVEYHLHGIHYWVKESDISQVMDK